MSANPRSLEGETAEEQSRDTTEDEVRLAALDKLSEMFRHEGWDILMANVNDLAGRALQDLVTFKPPKGPYPALIAFTQGRHQVFRWLAGLQHDTEEARSALIAKLNEGETDAT